MTTQEFRRWLRAHMDELQEIEEHPTPDEPEWLRCGSIAGEAGVYAARLGLPQLFEHSREFGAYADPAPVTRYLAECLAAIPAVDTQPTMLTEAETIEYLRLNVDERDPAERLRNLVRRQRLPCVKRGRLTLFRRTAIDAWLNQRN